MPAIFERIDMEPKLAFTMPLDGNCLTNKAGVLSEDQKSLLITVSLAAPAGQEIFVNGSKAKYKDGCYRATVPLTAYQNTVMATTDTGDTCSMTVYWLPRATNCYRLSLDDNIRFLEDLAAHKDTYRSIFENPYLAILKEAHERFGTKIHANLFYHGVKENGFTLSDMPDTFKAEFEANASWLHFSFHAKGEFPDRPYIDADYQKVDNDLSQVCREIARFAGEKVLDHSETTIHWGECSREGTKALHDRGLRILAGFLIWNKKQDSGLVSYFLDRDTILQSAHYGIHKDKNSDMIFSKIDVILNTGTKESLLAKLEEDYAKYPMKGFWEFLMHEQYFYPDYAKYLPDFRERIFAALAWAEEKGLTPAFLSETHLEA